MIKIFIDKLSNYQFAGDNTPLFAVMVDNLTANEIERFVNLFLKKAKLSIDQYDKYQKQLYHVRKNRELENGDNICVSAGQVAKMKNLIANQLLFPHRSNPLEINKIDSARKKMVEACLIKTLQNQVKDKDAIQKIPNKLKIVPESLAATLANQRCDRETTDSNQAEPSVRESMEDDFVLVQSTNAPVPPPFPPITLSANRSNKKVNTLFPSLDAEGKKEEEVEMMIKFTII